MNYVCNGTFRSFVALDFETTGLSGTKDYVTEIGAVKVVDGEVVQRFSTLVNPGRPIPPRVVALTGITNDMVEDHPRIWEILPLFLTFLGELPLVCHNAKFDCKFLERDLQAMGRFLNNPVDDTLSISRLKAKHLTCHKLGYLTEYFQIPLNDAHRAWCDAEATARLYLKLQEL